MDDLLSLLDGGEVGTEKIVPKSKENSAKSASSTVAAKSVSDFSTAFQDNSKSIPSTITNDNASTVRSSASNTLEENSKLRVVNRVTSRMELNELLYSHQFFSCTSLSAASKATLSNLIVKPSPSNELSGKTNLAIIAIMFHNSGTRISSKGSAFSILTLGDFTTGSLISLFLFGEAYSKFNSQSRKIHDGTVIAVLSPNILPTKPGSDTSLTFSVSQTDQIRIIGKAQDYGKCTGMCRSKRNGVFTETRCKQYVDLRVSAYCSLHAKQRFSNNAGSSNTSTSSKTQTQNMSFIQKMKMEKTPNGTRNTAATGYSPPSIKKEVNNNNNTHAILFPNMSQPSQPTPLISAPMHMKKRPISTTPTSQEKKKRLSDFLNINTKPLPSMRGRNMTQPKRKVAHVEGFDGSVFVPKPSAMFQKGGRAGNSNTFQNGVDTQRYSLLEDQEKAKERVLNKQRLLVERLQESKKISTVPQTTRNATLIQKNVVHNSRNQKALVSKKANSSLSKTDALFDSFEMSNDQMQKTLAASSKFAIEANAELFAENRKKLVDLQRKESSQTSKTKLNKNKDDNGKEKAIQTEYVCMTCKKKYAKKPMYCIKARHAIKLKRFITKQNTTVREERLKKHDNSGAEGGMILAAGLEWSGWKGS